MGESRKDGDSERATLRRLSSEGCFLGILTDGSFLKAREKMSGV